MHGRSLTALVALCLVWSALVGAAVDRNDYSASWAGTRIAVGIAVLILVWVAGLLAVRTARTLLR